jgi:hypothetical protein
MGVALENARLFDETQETLAPRPRPPSARVIGAPSPIPTVFDKILSANGCSPPLLR